MEQMTLPTEFAPAQRAGEFEILSQNLVIRDLEYVKKFIDASPNIMVVLNEERQIVFFNQRLLDYLGLTEGSKILGKRPGEVFNCANAYKAESGCGTSTFCKTCGAVEAILHSQTGYAAIQECRILQQTTGDALDLRIWTTPIRIDGQPFTIFSVVDISNEKRRRVLERIFFHDILNTASGLHGVASIIKKAPPEELNEIKELIYDLSSELIEKIQAQRELTAAENYELAIHPDYYDPVRIIEETVAVYRKQEIAHTRTIKISASDEVNNIFIDKVIFKRVLGNLIKNALEASLPEDTVSIGFLKKENQFEFWVHNPGCMAEEIRLQIFQRSFSTKGDSRGLGTYSIKLLTERYLHGKVSFSSTSEEGTIFNIFVPAKPI